MAAAAATATFHETWRPRANPWAIAITVTLATFMEALAPVPLDHVPDRDLDLVLGPDGGATHVER